MTDASEAAVHIRAMVNEFENKRLPDWAVGAIEGWCSIIEQEVMKKKNETQKEYTIKKEGSRHWRIYHGGERTSYSGDTYEQAMRGVHYLEKQSLLGKQNDDPDESEAYPGQNKWKREEQ